MMPAPAVAVLLALAVAAVVALWTSVGSDPEPPPARAPELTPGAAPPIGTLPERVDLPPVITPTATPTTVTGPTPEPAEPSPATP